MAGQDVIEVEILEDGTVKIVTDPISPANHTSADKLLSALQAALGGAATREKRKDATARHAHAHATGQAHGH